MIATLIGWGVGPRIAKLITYVGLPLLVLGIIWWRVDAYGDRRYQAGEAAADARWEEAGRRLQRQAAQSATKADDDAAARLETHQQAVAQERQEVDEAERSGGSPIDVLFGG